MYDHETLGQAFSFCYGPNTGLLNLVCITKVMGFKP